MSKHTHTPLPIYEKELTSAGLKVELVNDVIDGLKNSSVILDCPACKEPPKEKETPKEAANELEEVAQNWVRQNIHSKLGFINWTNGTASLVSLIESEKVKARIEELTGFLHILNHNNVHGSAKWFIEDRIKELESKEEA